MPLSLPIAYPLINGHRYDFSSVRITVNGIPYTGVKSLSYRQSMTPGLLRGTRSQVVGRTRGQYEAEGSIEFYKEDYQNLIAVLGAAGTMGYMEASFVILAQYSSGAITGGVVTDTLMGCRITSDEDSPAEGSDALVVSCDLSIMYILRDGKAALSPLQLLR